MRSRLRFAAPLALLLAAPVALAGQKRGAGTDRPFEGVYTRTLTFLGTTAARARLGAVPPDALTALRQLTPILDEPAAGVVRMRQTVYVKGAMLRVDADMPGPPGAGAYTLWDRAVGTTYTVMPSLRQVLVAPKSGLADLGMRAGPQDTARPTISDLGMRVIAGRRAHGYRLTGRASVEELWFDPVTPAGLADSVGAAGKQDVRPSRWAGLKGVRGEPFLALRLSQGPARLGGGWRLLRTETGNARRQAVPDTLFKLPKDFAQVSAQQLMTGRMLPLNP